MASVDQVRRLATKRLMKDLDEIRTYPMPNISAVPLNDDFFEWHCCVSVDNTIFHIILTFSDDYPQSAPSAQFFPIGLAANDIVSVSRGEKGSKFCLSLFSDYHNAHKEWQTDVGYGWSPCYTVQTLLINISAFLSENKLAEKNIKLLKDAERACPECGYTCVHPFPALPATHRLMPVIHNENQPVISCYISRHRFDGTSAPLNKNELFGVGVDIRYDNKDIYLGSPCETLIYDSYREMIATSGFAQTTLKEKFNYFLPVFLHPKHGEHIKELFESSVKKLVKGVVKNKTRKLCKTPSMAEDILNVIPNLMATAVQDFTKDLEGSADQLNGFFFFHRLFLWATEAYPSLQPLVNQRIESFLEKEKNRKRKAFPYIEEWLMLLSISDKYRWEDVADVYITEVWEREVLLSVKNWPRYNKHYIMCDDVDDTTAIDSLFDPLEFLGTNKRISLQMAFLKAACPYGYSREDIIRRYDNHLGYPTNEMKSEVRTQLKAAREAKVFIMDWFKVWDLGPVTARDVRNLLIRSLKLALKSRNFFLDLDDRDYWADGLRKWCEKYPSESLPKLTPLKAPTLKIPDKHTFIPVPTTSGSNAECLSFPSGIGSQEKKDRKQGTQTTEEVEPIESQATARPQ